MSLIRTLVLALAIGVVTGVGSAWLAVSGEPLVNRVTVGSWTAWPETGGPEADPYTLAYLARTGTLSLGAGEGVAFVATTDANGEPMSPDCVYSIEGRTPAARLWTLSVHDSEARPMKTRSGRTSFHSGELLRDQDGRFAITLSVEVAPGNWLPIAEADGYELTLRLYDTPLATGARIAEVEMPVVRRVGCR